MTYKILLPQEIMAEGREYLESRGYQLINGSGMEEEDIIRDIVDTYPVVVPVLQSIGMGCLGCPSSTAEPLWQAAEIHGVNVYDLVEKLETARKGA